MKTIMIASIALILASASTQAQPDYAVLNKKIQDTHQEESVIKKEKKAERKALRKLDGHEVSYQSKEQFAADFANATNVTWKRTVFFDEATFTQDGRTQTAYYDIHNDLVGTTELKQFADLPASAQKTILKRYKDYTIEKVILFDDNETNDTDMLMYGRQFDDADNYFVEIQKGAKDLVLQVDMSGDVSYFGQM